MGKDDFFLGRQPVFDRDGKMFAFELLFRSGEQNGAKFKSGLVATSRVLQYAFSELGLENSLGNFKGFINIDAEFLFDDLVELVPRHCVGLELTKDVPPTEANLKRIAELKKEGYFFSLDDAEDQSRIAPFASLVDFVKFNSEGIPQETARSLVNWCHQHGLDVCAKRVDSKAYAAILSGMGVDLFQGYFFAEPEMLKGRRIKPSEHSIMKLMSLLRKDASVREIEMVFKASPELAVNLLRLVNSVALRMRNPVSSIQHAIIALGRNQLQKWLQLLLFSDGKQDKQSPVMLMAAMRAVFLEKLTKEAGGSTDDQDMAFMTGILSLLEVAMGVPLSDILPHFPIDETVTDALLKKEGVLGKFLAAAELLDRGDFSLIEEISRDFPALTADKVSKIQADALAWASNINNV